MVNQQLNPNPEAGINPLEKYGINLTELAKEGKIDPVIGCEDEIRRIIQILSRRKKNNPVLIGEPGTGKTTIVEGLAKRIVEGDVPENIKEKQLITMDLSAMVAGAMFKGQFEERLKNFKDTDEGHVAELARIKNAALKKGSFSSAVNAETNRGKAAGLYIERKIIKHGKLEDMSEQELEAKMKQILDDYAPILNVTPKVQKLENNKTKQSHSPSKQNGSSKD